ncbi:MAG: DUF1016 N-terminal domain-containing protein [Candidatus Sericytochromatia bacterium]
MQANTDESKSIPGPLPDPRADSLAEQVLNLVATARHVAVASLHSLQVLSYFEIGRLLSGQEAETELTRLETQLGPGFTAAQLDLMRQFYLAWKDRAAPVSQRTAPQPGQVPLVLSWPHYLFLLGIADAVERDFYEREAAQNAWPLAELERRVRSGYYQTLSQSPDPARVRQEADVGEITLTPQQSLNDPHLRDFLGLN